MNLKLNLFILFLLISIDCFSQIDIFLRLQDHHGETISKYYVGQTFEYELREYPGHWYKARIKKFIPEENLILTEKGTYLKPPAIKSIRQNNGTALAFSAAFLSFGGGIAIFGGIGYASEGDVKQSIGSIIVGGLIAGVGWLVRKLRGKKKYDTVEFYYLDIIDTRFEAPSNTP